MLLLKLELNSIRTFFHYTLTHYVRMLRTQNENFIKNDFGFLDFNDGLTPKIMKVIFEFSIDPDFRNLFHTIRINFRIPNI